MARDFREKYLYIDCGNIATKALLVEVDKDVKVLGRGEALTTAGFGVDDVSMGAARAIKEIEESTGLRLLASGSPLRLRPDAGIEGVLAASSVAGGAVAAVAGVFRDISAESAQRAALLGGACVTDVFSINDERLPHERRIDLKQRPLDFLIIAGGVDEGDSFMKNPGHQALIVSRLLVGGLPWSRHKPGERPTIIFAGSMLVREQITEMFDGIAPVEMTENVRPKLENENLEPARTAVVDLFKRAVGHSPRYANLPCDVVPVGYSVMRAIEESTRRSRENTLVVDIGGAFTSVYSSVDSVLNRTILDFDGSISNGAHGVVRSKDVARWTPFGVSMEAIGTIIGNRRVRPHTVPESWAELAIRLGIIREEARQGLALHRQLAVTLRGVQRQRQIHEIFGADVVGGQSIVDLSKVRNIVLAGGWLSGRNSDQIAIVAMEGLQTSGVNVLYADADSKLCMLGGLLEAGAISPDAVFPALTCVGTCISPMRGKERHGVAMGVGTITIGNPVNRIIHMEPNTITRVPLATGQSAEVTINPGGNVDFGAGSGQKVVDVAVGGESGLIIDTRPRPLAIAIQDDRRTKVLVDCWKSLDAFPKDLLASWERGEHA